MRGMMTGTANKFSSAPSVFTPNSIDNLEFWVDGDTGYVDLSDNELMITGSGAAITSNAINGHDALSYNGAVFNTVGAPVVDPSELYVIMVTVANSTDENIFFSHRSESTRLIQCVLHNTESRLATRGSAASLNTVIAADIHSNWGIREYSFKKTAQQVVTPTATGNASINYTGQTFNSTQWTLGGYITIGPTPSAVGDIAFLAVYSTTPTPGQRANLNSYLQDRYAL